MKYPKTIDLHMHSTVSDGTDTPEEILKHVKAAGIEMFSLTDHDAIKGCVHLKDIRKEDDMIRFRITGNGFLYNMVRILAGTLLEIGKGTIEPGSMPEILDARSRAAAGPTAPPHGLTLMEIRYPEWGF